MTPPRTGLGFALLLILLPLGGAHTPQGTPKNWCETGIEPARHEYAPPAQDAMLVSPPLDGSLLPPFGCGGPGMSDGHKEFAIGGAWLAADEGDGLTHGSAFCRGETAHHPNMGVIHLESGDSAGFVVAVDAVSLTGDPCGDNVFDQSLHCWHGCVPPFPAGLDGYYVVLMDAAPFSTSGHVYSP